MVLDLSWRGKSLMIGDVTDLGLRIDLPPQRLHHRILDQHRLIGDGKPPAFRAAAPRTAVIGPVVIVSCGRPQDSRVLDRLGGDDPERLGR